MSILSDLSGPIIVLALVATILLSYWVFIKTGSIGKAYLPTLIPPVVTVIFMVVLILTATDNSWLDIILVVVGIIGFGTSMGVLVIVAIMLAVIKKKPR